MATRKRRAPDNVINLGRHSGRNFQDQVMKWNEREGESPENAGYTGLPSIRQSAS